MNSDTFWSMPNIEAPIRIRAMPIPANPKRQPTLTTVVFFIAIASQARLRKPLFLCLGFAGRSSFEHPLGSA